MPYYVHGIASPWDTLWPCFMLMRIRDGGDISGPGQTCRRHHRGDATRRDVAARARRLCLRLACWKWLGARFSAGAGQMSSKWPHISTDRLRTAIGAAPNAVRPRPSTRGMGRLHVYAIQGAEARREMYISFAQHCSANEAPENERLNSRVCGRPESTDCIPRRHRSGLEGLPASGALAGNACSD